MLLVHSSITADYLCLIKIAMLVTRILPLFCAMQMLQTISFLVHFLCIYAPEMLCFLLNENCIFASLKLRIKNSVCKKVYFSSVSEPEKLYNKKENGLKPRQFGIRAFARSLDRLYNWH